MPKIYLNLFFCVCCFVFGWIVHGWKVGSDANEIFKENSESQKEISVKLEKKLSELKANEKTIIKEVTKVIENPVYLHDCFDDSGVYLVNLSKSGATRPVSGVP